MPLDSKITRIVGFDLECVRSKVAGKNSRLDVHGDRIRDPMIRIFTDTGHEGLGWCRTAPETLKTLLGRNPLDFLLPDRPAIRSPLGSATMPLWDLIARMHEKPVYQMLGAKGSERISVYDGSIYFADLLPEYADSWEDRFKEEIDMGLAEGHRAFKIKIGRGAKWMPQEEGDSRDRAVLKLIRAHAGPDVALFVDANNGYTLERTKQLLSDLQDISLGLLEEMFPENLDECLELRSFIRGQGLKTLVGDGETLDSVETLKPLMEAGAIDIYQLDMNCMGWEGIMEEAELAAPAGGRVAPHNWGSLVGHYAMLHVGRALPNFFAAEYDPLYNDVLTREGFPIENGKVRVPDTPGFGLGIDEETFASTVKPKFDLTL